MQTTLPIQFGAAQSLTEFSQTRTGKVVLSIGATVFVAISAHISISLYFTPVPITLQTLAVLLVGFAFGPTLGFATMVLYLAEGAAGLPVFSPHGPGGIAQLLGPTGGFLFSYPLAAAAAGYVLRTVRLTRSQFPEALLAGALATVVIFAMGAGWLAYLLHLNLANAWHLAVYPFLPGEVIKVLAASGLVVSLRRWRQY